MTGSERLSFDIWTVYVKGIFPVIPGFFDKDVQIFKGYIGCWTPNVLVTS